MQKNINDVLFKQAKNVIPGGVNSPVRSFIAVGGSPVFIKKAKGAYLYGENSKKYIDYVASWGAILLGHSNRDVVTVVQQYAEKGISFGAPTIIETEIAKLICHRLPWIEQIRMVNSGTEATMSAIRLARGYTGKDKIIKFNGCYHGHSDSLLVKSGSGAKTFGVMSSPGVPQSIAQQTLIATFNDLASVEKIFNDSSNQIAAVIIEPIAGNMNCIQPVDGFLEGIRSLCDQYRSLLIMDEVMTGFRVGSRGAQGIYNVYGDLTILGKIIGGGIPVGAFGGRYEIMQHLTPLGKIYQAGTLSGNPLAMIAGLKTLQLIDSDDFFLELENKTRQLVNGMVNAAKDSNISISANYLGGMFGLIFTDQGPVTCFSDVKSCNYNQFNRFFHGMLDRGVYLAPSVFESGFVSAAHSNDDIKKTIDIAHEVFLTLH